MSSDHLVMREQLPLPSPYVAPRTPTQERLARLWSDVLGMDVVGVDDEFSDLGGDSLMATILFAMIDQAFGRKLPLAVLATASTVAKLAARLDAPEDRVPR